MFAKGDNQIHPIIYSSIACIVILVIDINLELGIAGGVPYLIVIFLMSLQNKTRYIFYAAVLTSILTLVGLYISPSGGELYKVLTNRFLALLAIWSSYYYVIQLLRSQEETIRLEKEYANELKERNAEKEILLKEIHHRVKNNLQVITGLLSLQAAFIEDKKIKNILSYSQYRINSMAMIHEMLYKTENLTSINYQEYLLKLVNDLCKSFKGLDSNIKTEIRCEISLNIDTAIPLGLLINEIVTNSLKYAFNEKDVGLIRLSIEPLEYPNFIMKISDNGKGFNGADFRNSNSLGLKLIHKLALQLNGNIEKDNSQQGTYYILTFQEITQL
jgi:two-component sensor histidine kinase